MIFLQRNQISNENDCPQIHRIYRSTEASVSKAQQEFATNFLRNDHVQNAASNVAATAVRAQMANAANQPRY